MKHSLCALLLAAASIGWTQTAKLGIFTDEGSVGKTLPGSQAQYDAAKGEYRITGGGENIWGATDAFYFVYRKMTGDMALTADVQFVGASPTEHRKAVLMIRQNLDANSPYVDVASHGNGTTALQFRGTAGAPTYQFFTQIDGPVRVRIVKQGSRYTMYSAKVGQELTAAHALEFVTLTDPVYVGIGVCSHDVTRLETAVFSNVKIEPAGK